MACEMNSGDELVATELIFAGVLAELAPEEAVALLSALVFQVFHLCVCFRHAICPRPCFCALQALGSGSPPLSLRSQAV